MTKLETRIHKVADTLAKAMQEQFPVEDQYMADEDRELAKEIAVAILSDDRKFAKATELDLRKDFLYEVTTDDGKGIRPEWSFVFQNVWFRMAGKQVHKHLKTDVKKCLENSVFIWSV